MRLIAALEQTMIYNRRRYMRQATNFGAGLSANLRPGVAVTVTDLSVGGCGITTELMLAPGARVWIRLPGLESVPARVAWAEDGRAGLSFDHPFHPAVVARFVALGD